VVIVSIAWTQALDDYRTAQSGDWNNTATWERYNGTAWEAATTTPTSANGVITILADHTVTITAAVTIDQVVVDADGAVIINSGVTVTLANGTGLDLSISGDFTLNGTLTMDGQGNEWSSTTVNDGGTLTVNGTYATGSAGARGNRTTTTISGGGSIVFGTTGTTSGQGEVVILANASLTSTSASGVDGHFPTVAKAFSTDANYIFDGTATSMVTGYFLPTTVNNLTINNPNGVAITNSTTVNGVLYQLSGSITGTIAPDGYESAYLVVAESGVSMQNFSASSSTSPDPTYTYIDRQWTFNTTTNTPKDVTFTWSSDEDYDFDWSETYKLAIFFGETKYTYNGPYPLSDPRLVTFSITDVSTLSGTIKIGRADAGTLPVELSSFTAVLSATNFIQLQWVTQSETNCAGYRLYRNQSDDLETATMLNAFIEATNTSQMQIYVYWDREVYEDGTYYYWLQNLDFDGTHAFHGPISITVTFENTGTPNIPIITGINSAFPNPFNPRTTIEIGLARGAHTTVAVYNQRGQLVRNLLNGYKEMGTYMLSWDGTDNNGRILPSGTYLIRMDAGGVKSHHKVVLMK